MKLYHIDRFGSLKEGSIIEKIRNFRIQEPFLKQENDQILNEYFPEGISHHGRMYFFDGFNSASYAMDIIFEYERRLHYPDKLSRYEAFYAFDLNSLLAFIDKKGLKYEFFKIYEIECDNYERHNLEFIRGWSHFETIVNSKYYWEDREDYQKDRKPIYEYLCKLPITIGKEVSLEELEKQKEEVNNNQ